MSVAQSVTRLFNHPEGKEVLTYLKRRTQERVLSPDSSDRELWFLEGQRSMVALILSLIQQGQQ